MEPQIAIKPTLHRNSLLFENEKYTIVEIPTNQLQPRLLRKINFFFKNDLPLFPTRRRVRYAASDAEYSSLVHRLARHHRAIVFSGKFSEQISILDRAKLQLYESKSIPHFQLLHSPDLLIENQLC